MIETDCSSAECTRLLGGPGACPPLGKILKFRSLKRHFEHSESIFPVKRQVLKQYFKDKFYYKSYSKHEKQQAKEHI